MQDQSATQPTLPTLPDVPTPPAPPSAPQVVGYTTGTGDPAEVFAAFQAQGRELARQLERLQDRRGDLTRRLRPEEGEQKLNAVDQKGIESQLADVDARIAEVNKQIAASDASIARAAGVPGAQKPDAPEVHRGPPETVVAITIVFILAVLFPIALAYARRLWKRAAVAPAVLPAEMGDRLTRLEQAMDSVAVEVERIGEGQRFVTKLFAESPRPMELPK